MVITGELGIGKTSLVTMYFELTRDRYAAQVSMHASEIDTPAGIFDRLSDHRRRGANISERATPERPWLVFVDDVDRVPFPDTFIPALMREMSTRQAGSFRWILASTSFADPNILSSYAFQQIDIPPMEQADIEELIHKRLALLPPERVAYATEIAANLGRITSTATHELGGNPRRLMVWLSEAYDSDSLAEGLERLEARLGLDLTSILVVPSDIGISVIPALQLPPAEIVTSELGSLLAAPYVPLRALRRYWRQELEELEALLNDPAVSERSIQRFLERNKSILKGLDYVDVLPHPVFERRGAGPLIPDFFLQPLSGSFGDLVELKLPTEKIVVGSVEQPRFSSAIARALAQVRRYRNYFEDPQHRELVQSRYGFTAYRPSVSIVIGRTSDLSEIVRQQMHDELPKGVQVMTYDQLHTRLRHTVEHLSL
jgi:hypothetical protein